FFFFSSRRRHTRSDRDWSSDVCSSDLDTLPRDGRRSRDRARAVSGLLPLYDADEIRALDSAAIEGLGLPGTVLMERAGLAAAHRSEERRVGKEGRAGVGGGQWRRKERS